jgi:sec-independent protein translocase protein TatA
VGIGAPELIIVLIIVLVIFGGAKLPKLAKSLGEAKREFEASTKDDKLDEGETKKTA